MDALYLFGLRIHWCTNYLLTYLLAYLHSWLGRIKPAISPKRLKIKQKLLLTAYIKSYTGFRLTLNDLCAKFKVIDSLNAAKMAKCSLVMTPTPCRVAGRKALVHLLTYLHSWLGRIKSAIYPKWLKIDRKLLLTGGL